MKIFQVLLINILFVTIAIADNDIVINSTCDPIWSSVIFTIPVDAPFSNQLLSFCKSKSIYYCLTSYEGTSITILSILPNY